MEYMVHRLQLKGSVQFRNHYEEESLHEYYYVSTTYTQLLQSHYNLFYVINTCVHNLKQKLYTIYINIIFNMILKL
jgi:hypothetical protein